MKYLTKFETQAAYDAAKDGLILPNVSLITETMGVVYKPYVQPTPSQQNNVITYTANAKLSETTSTFLSGLHTNVFSGSSGQLTITSHTFSNGVGTIEFSDSITSIGERAFNECDGLTSVTIPESVTSIGERAFNECDGLTSVTIPESVTSIGRGAFEFCTSLTDVTIPENVTFIGNFAFANCLNLVEITFLTRISPELAYDDTFSGVADYGILHLLDGHEGYDNLIKYLEEYGWTVEEIYE